MKYIYTLFRLILNIIYLPIKLFRVKNNKIVFLSRQFNSPTLDFKMIAEELRHHNQDFEIVFMCKRFDNIKKNILPYSIFTIKTMYHISTSKVCIVDSFSVVSMLWNKRSLKVLQIWHALGAIKKFSYQTLDTSSGRSKAAALGLRMHYGYDAIITSSNETTKYFKEAFNYPEEKFINYGLPRIDYLLKNEAFIKSKILKSYPDFANKETILYAPTFRNEGRDQTELLIKNIDCNKYNLIIKSHLNQNLKFDNQQVYTCDDFSAMELLCVCDYLITDYSAIALEASLLNKKTYYYVYDYEEYERDNGLNVDLYKEMPGCVFKDIKELVKTLEEDNYDINLVENYKHKYIDNLKGNSTKLIANLIIDWSLEDDKKDKKSFN